MRVARHSSERNAQTHLSDLYHASERRLPCCLLANGQLMLPSLAQFKQNDSNGTLTWKAKRSVHLPTGKSALSGGAS